MKLSELYGKTVVSDSGKKGYVLGIKIFDGRLSTIRCSDFEEREFEISAGDVLSIGKEIAFRDTAEEKTKSKSLSLGKCCYDVGGKFLGYLKEVEFKSGKITRIKIAAKSFAADSVIFGDAIIIDRRRRLKESVIKDGKVIFASGQEVSDSLIEAAISHGEYVQTTLKSL